MKKRNMAVNLIVIFVLFISSIIFFFAHYISSEFEGQNIDKMIYYITSGMDGTSTNIFTSALQAGLIPTLLLFFVLSVPIIRIKKWNHIIEVSFKDKKLRFCMFPINIFYKFRVIYACIMFTLSLTALFNFLDTGAYIKRLNSYSTFIESHYVDGSKVPVVFPENKRNLIILYVESLENSMINVENGGGWRYSVIPELEKIALENINFSDSVKIGGAYPISGTDWTVGALVATTSGLPLKIPVDGNNYTSSKNFLSGAYTLGDILKNEGYSLELMVGSDANFGGRKNYYEKHGDYKIFDLNTAIIEGKMDSSDSVWWGFDDSHLFEWAKEEISLLAKSKKPFSFSFLTVNTHFPDGYLESQAEKKFETQYENVHAFSSKQINEFVEWFQNQNFYSDTTLIILGDHLSMQPNNYFSLHTYDGYQRSIYNAFINTSIDPIDTNNRLFTPLDFYPTILASIGVKIEGDRLGLGTNLFSDKKTLVEEFGYEHVNEELAMNSSFYNKYILQGDFLDLLDQLN